MGFFEEKQTEEPNNSLWVEKVAMYLIYFFMVKQEQVKQHLLNLL